MIFCSKCGKQLPEGAVFCGECGNRISNANNQVPQYAPGQSAQQVPNYAPGQIPRYYPAYNYEYKPKGKGIVVTIITLVIVAALAVGAYFIFWHDSDGSGNRSSGGGDQNTIKKTLEKYAQAWVDGDAESMLETAFPKSMWDDMEDVVGTTVEDAKKAIMREWSTDTDDYNERFGKNIKTDVVILEKQKIDRERIKEIEEIGKKLDKGFDIDEAYKVEFEMTIKGSDGEETDIETLELFKIDSQWYALTAG